MPKGAIFLAAALLLFAVISGVRSLDLGGEPEVDGATTTTTTHLPDIEGPPPPARRFKSLDELVATMGSAGLECTYLDEQDVPEPSVKAFAICDVGDPANRFDIYLYETTFQRNLWFPSRVDSGLPWVYGPNWIVVIAGESSTTARRSELLRLAIGGKVGSASSP